MQTIYLDISNKGVVPTVYAKQNDVGRKFAVILTDSGLPYIPEIGSVFSVWYKGASGEGNYTDIGDKPAFSLSGNKVEVEMIVQMLSAHGDGILCLTLNSPDGNQISSWNIPYMCEIVPGSESEKAEEYYTAFSKAVEELPYPDETLSIEGKAADAAAVGKSLAKKADISYTKKIGSPYNLLDNSDFRNPVNQRGQTSYSGYDFNGYNIDRWVTNAGTTVTINDGFIKCSGDNVMLVQRMEHVPSGICTLACKLENGDIHVISGLFTIAEQTDGVIAFAINPSGQAYIKLTTTTGIVWAALYEGEYTAKTLPEYQPKGYGAELAECLRYFERLGGHDSDVLGNSMFCVSGFSSFIASVQYYPKRIPHPTVKLYDPSNYRLLFKNHTTAQVYSAGAIKSFDEVFCQSPFAQFRVTLENAENQNAWVTLQRADNAPEPFIDVCADL